MIGARELELEVAGVEEEASAKEKDEPGSLFKDPEYRASPPGSRDLPVHKELYPGDDWVTHARIDENPVNKGDTISALIRRAHGNCVSGRGASNIKAVWKYAGRM